MAYFPNGTSAEIAREEYCSRCVHGQDQEAGCPVWDLHQFWNYDAVGVNADKDKKFALDWLWPMEPDGIQHGDCRMFAIADKGASDG
jgi:hypothetical protein